MQSLGWINLLRLMPSELQETLLITTANGLELNIQSIIRMEMEYLVFKGRQAASTEAGRIYFVPYDQITFVNFTRTMKDSEVNALYGATPQQGFTAIPQPRPPVDEMEPMADDEPAPLAPAGAAEPMRAPLAAKSAMIDRLRSRSHPGTSQRPG
jgi:hypothetical protein